MTAAGFRRVGVLGVGHVGLSVALRLQAGGHTVGCYDVSAKAVARLADADVQVFDSSAALAAHSEVLICTLPGPEQTQTELLRRGGALLNLQSRSLLIDMTTTSRECSADLQAACRARRVTYVDAPFSGAIPDAVVFAGGTDEDVDKASDVLRLLSGSILRVGPAGSGVTVKLIHQLVAYANAVALAEGVSLGSALGVDTRMLMRALASGSAYSRSIDNAGDRLVERRFGDASGAPLRLIAKDMRLVADAAAQGPGSLALPGRLRDLFNDADTRGLGGEHYSTILQLLE